MHLPPEWWPQSAVMLTWPHAAGDWGTNLPQVEANFVAIAAQIALRQAVLISAPNPGAAQLIRSQLQAARVNLAQVHIAIAPSNDIWVRDHGPLTIVDKDQAQLLNFNFNGWGGKYPSGLDNTLTRTLHEQGFFGTTAIQDIDLVVEGGAIEVNGEGCLLTSTACLDLPSRNPGMDTHSLGAKLGEALGCETVHWLSHGQLQGDDTDGHIDTLARFTDANCIVYQGCENPADEHYAELQAMADELAELRNPHGEPYTLNALPMPGAIYNAHGQRLPASYANFLIINDAVLMPGYADPMDSIAAQVLDECFPNREIVTIDCRALVEQFGSLHCATMQLPQAVNVQSPS
ncbi:MAG: agmatine deiminase family protein [Salinisphaeraceae bacterium]|nr:agmatine deiminase family protein [Salinisphaeraceae bacterium]